MLLCDTDVMVDVFRGYLPAVRWFQTLGDEPLGVPGLVAIELIRGCHDREEQNGVEAKLRPYILYWPSQEDCVRAYKDFTEYHLSHGIGILDALIAETAVGLGLTIATFNTKHYRVIGGLNMIEPYRRES